MVKAKDVVVLGCAAAIDGFTLVGDEPDDPSTGSKFPVRVATFTK
ncbi:hypothetical protein [Kibdelosporangium persicum]|nr:hypothetical protein [Kibdelosporangium persicum]